MESDVQSKQVSHKESDPRTTAGAEEPLAELARSLFLAGDMEGALEAYDQSLALAPDRADLLVELANVWQSLQDHESALACYRRAVAVAPDNISARQNLGYLLCNLGEPEAAIEQYELVLQQWPSPISRMLSATVLPVIYGSASEVQTWRQRFTDQVTTLNNAGLRVDTARSQIPTNFLLAYQGENDRELASRLGTIYRGCDMCTRLAPGTAKKRQNRRLRVGFLSAFYHDHTIGRLSLGMIQHLSRDQFEVVVLSAGSTQDAWAEAFIEAADQFVVVPRNVEIARKTVSEQMLDVLVFTDVGMDAVTSTLVYSRMAPVQCVQWGHPETTGSPAIDYFLSSELLETAESDAHYTEQLVRLPELGIYYHRPMRTGEPRPRAYYGLSDSQHIYVCPQTLYKFHPDFDHILAGILRRDPDAELVLLEGRVRNWMDRLRKRFQKTLPNGDRRVRFLPAQKHEDYLSLFQVADVILDPLYFSGGNSSFEAFAMSAPVVTLPGRFQRGRFTLAMYRKMNFDELVVDSPEHYVDVAVRLGTNAEFNRTMRQRIQQKASVLFDDPEEIRRIEPFLSRIATNGGLSS